MDIDSMTLGELKQIAAVAQGLLGGVSQCAHVSDPPAGEAVFIRTVTHHYTGRVVSCDARWMVLEDAAWVADDGRFANALESGVLQEVEPYPDGAVRIGMGAILDVSSWDHELPRSVVE